MHALKTLWKEVLNLIEGVKTLHQVLGPGKKLDIAYERKIGLLAKLVEAFVNLTYRELSMSASKLFSVEFELMENAELHALGFHDFLAMVVSRIVFVSLLLLLITQFFRPY